MIMLQTVQGIFKNGKVELQEIPVGITESEVFVTFLNTESSTTKKQITYGMFNGSIQSTEADFQEAEYQES
jgi:hypothetical protein